MQHIVIGKGGATLRLICERSQADLARAFSRPVRLSLQVNVIDNKNDEAAEDLNDG